MKYVKANGLSCRRGERYTTLPIVKSHRLAGQMVAPGWRSSDVYLPTYLPTIEERNTSAPEPGPFECKCGASARHAGTVKGHPLYSPEVKSSYTGTFSSLYNIPEYTYSRSSPTLLRSSEYCIGACVYRKSAMIYLRHE